MTPPRDLYNYLRGGRVLATSWIGTQHHANGGICMSDAPTVSIDVDHDIAAAVRLVIGAAAPPHDPAVDRSLHTSRGQCAGINGRAANDSSRRAPCHAATLPGVTGRPTTACASPTRLTNGATEPTQSAKIMANAARAIPAHFKRCLVIVLPPQKARRFRRR